MYWSGCQSNAHAIKSPFLPACIPMHHSKSFSLNHKCNIATGCRTDEEMIRRGGRKVTPAFPDLNKSCPPSLLTRHPDGPLLGLAESGAEGFLGHGLATCQGDAVVAIIDDEATVLGSSMRRFSSSR